MSDDMIHDDDRLPTHAIDFPFLAVAGAECARGHAIAAPRGLVQLNATLTRCIGCLGVIPVRDVAEILGKEGVLSPMKLAIGRSA